MKLSQILLTAILAAAPLTMLGRPASPEIARHKNPDGTTVEFSINGNEEFSYYTDVAGQRILELKDGAIVPAYRNGEPLYVNEASFNILKKELPPMIKPLPADVKNQTRMASLDLSGRSTYPTLGNVRACVILLEYPDFPFTMEDPQGFFNRMCNEKGYSDFRSKGSAKDYYEDVSNGKFSPTFDVYGPVKLQHEAKWYVGADMDPAERNKLNNPRNARLGCAIQEALAALDDTVDFSIYDYDEDGLIDNIFFFYSGRGQADCAQYDAELAPYTIWPHQWDYRYFTSLYTNSLGLDRVFIDGKEMATYACSCELNSSRSCPSQPWVDGIGAFCHEYGHVLGLPDMYNTTNTPTKTPGYYDVMDAGTYNDMSCTPPTFSAYEQWLCKWLEYTDAEDGTSYTLNPLTSENRNVVRIRIPRPGNRYYAEYFLVECRSKEGWDKFIPSHGMLIWRINYSTPSLWVNNLVNGNGVANVELITPSKAEDSGLPGIDSPQTYITPSTGELTSSILRKPVDATLANITYDYELENGGIATFDYNKYKENDYATVLHDDVKGNQLERQFTLEWDPVEGATDYQLTLKRRDSSGREWVVNGLDNMSIGNVTSYTVKNITALQWSQTFTAYVRVVSGIPSTAVSNKVTFVPENLSDSGVDEITAVLNGIYGGKGEITAPAGARVFNLNGVETGTQNLPAGVYIVVTPYATAKVVVK